MSICGVRFFQSDPVCRVVGAREASRVRAPSVLESSRVCVGRCRGARRAVQRGVAQLRAQGLALAARRVRCVRCLRDNIKLRPARPLLVTLGLADFGHLLYSIY